MAALYRQGEKKRRLLVRGASEDFSPRSGWNGLFLAGEGASTTVGGLGLLGVIECTEAAGLGSLLGAGAATAGLLAAGWCVVRSAEARLGRCAAGLGAVGAALLGIGLGSAGSLAGGAARRSAGGGVIGSAQAWIRGGAVVGATGNRKDEADSEGLEHELHGFSPKVFAVADQESLAGKVQLIR